MTLTLIVNTCEQLCLFTIMFSRIQFLLPFKREVMRYSQGNIQFNQLSSCPATPLIQRWSCNSGSRGYAASFLGVKIWWGLVHPQCLSGCVIASIHQVPFLYSFVDGQQVCSPALDSEYAGDCVGFCKFRRCSSPSLGHATLWWEVSETCWPGCTWPWKACCCWTVFLHEVGS